MRIQTLRRVITLVNLRYQKRLSFRALITSGLSVMLKNTDDSLRIKILDHISNKIQSMIVNYVKSRLCEDIKFIEEILHNERVFTYLIYALGTKN